MKRPRIQPSRKSSSLILVGIALALVAVGAMSPESFNRLVQPGTLQTAADQAAEIIGAAAEDVSEAQPGLAKVNQVVDGDTIQVTLGGKAETVRFIGIDTPETHDPRKPVQCFGEAAAAHSRQLLEGKSVRLEADPTNSNRDKYNRLLRYVYLPDGTLVNASLIADGFAFAYVVFPYERLDEFVALESEARANNKGLWGGCNVDASNKIKQTTTQR